MRAVRFDAFGDETVLHVRKVDDPVAGRGLVVVRVKAAAINPGEMFIRLGMAEHMWTTTFPCGEGSDVAGEVVAIGEGVKEFTVGQAVLGWSNERSTHAELVAVPANQLVPKPPGLSWKVAGAMFVAPMAALASVRAVQPSPGETVAVSGGAGGVGSVAVQLAVRTGATVIGIASAQNHDWMRAHGVVPVEYGNGLPQRLSEQAGGRLDAFIDTFGDGYVDMALGLGVEPQRINTIIDFAAVHEHGVNAQGCSDAGTTDNIAELAELAATGELEIPIERAYPMEQVREAYRHLAKRHTRGKIVLVP